MLYASVYRYACIWLCAVGSVFWGATIYICIYIYIIVYLFIYLHIAGAPRRKHKFSVHANQRPNVGRGETPSDFMPFKETLPGGDPDLP